MLNFDPTLTLEVNELTCRSVPETHADSHTGPHRPTRLRSRGSYRGAKLKSPHACYRILDFLVRRCRTCSGAVDRALIDGRLRLPADLNVQSHAQNYLLNWVSRMDRRTSVPAALTECWDRYSAGVLVSVGPSRAGITSTSARSRAWVHHPSAYQPVVLRESSAWMAARSVSPAEANSPGPRRASGRQGRPDAAMFGDADEPMPHGYPKRDCGRGRRWG